MLGSTDGIRQASLRMAERNTIVADEDERNCAAATLKWIVEG